MNGPSENLPVLVAGGGIGGVAAAPKGFSTAAYRSTDATVFAPIEGRGRTHIGDSFVVEWEKRDLVVVRQR